MLAKRLGAHFALLDESQYATLGVAVLLSEYLYVGHVSWYAKWYKDYIVVVMKKALALCGNGLDLNFLQNGVGFAVSAHNVFVSYAKLLEKCVMDKTFRYLFAQTRKNMFRGMIFFIISFVILKRICYLCNVSITKQLNTNAIYINIITI